MMEYDFYLLLGGFAAVVFYYWLRIRLSALAQPLRFELADIGEELLADARVPNHDKRLVEFILSSLFSRGMAWRLAFAFPLVIARGPRSDREAEQSLNRLPSDIQKKLGRVVRLGTIATLSNSPIAMWIFANEIVFSALVVAPTGRLLRRTVNHLFDSAETSEQVARKLAH